MVDNLIIVISLKNVFVYNLILEKIIVANLSMLFYTAALDI